MTRRTPQGNALFYGDNLHILRSYIEDESVDLDPPFNSNATYNVLFRAPGGEASQAQIEAFPQVQFETHGVPKDAGAARELASADKHQFQLWACAFVEAQPFKGGRKGADGGVDGYIFFKPDGKVTEKAIVSVKGGGNVGVGMIRDLIATVDREKAKVGILLSLEDPTTTMRREASAAGLYKTDMHGDFPKIQILTVEDLFDGKKPLLPWIDASVFRKARRENIEQQPKLDL